MTPTPAPTIAPPLTAEAEQRIRDYLAMGNACCSPAEIRSLLASLDEARKDSKRLDWLQANRADVDTDGPGFVIYTEENSRGGGASKGSYEKVRSAIDAAMSKKGSQ